MSNWEEIRKYIAKSNLPEPIKQHLLMQYSKPHPANLKAQQKALHKKPTVYFYGSGKKKTVKEVETPKTVGKTTKTAKSKSVVVTPPPETGLPPGNYPSWQLREWAEKYPEWYEQNRELFGEEKGEEIEFTQAYRAKQKKLVEKVASGELTPQEAQQALRSIRALGTYYGTVEKARRSGQLSKKEYREYVSKFKNIKLPELIYGKPPKGWVSEWDNPQAYYELRKQLESFKQKYGKYLGKEDREIIEKLLKMHYLPANLNNIIVESIGKIKETIEPKKPSAEEKEKKLRKFELEHQPKQKSMAKVPFSIGEAPAKISYEELLGKGVKTPDIGQLIPGMEFLQLSYQASKKLATTGLKLEPTWEEKVEKAVEKQQKLLKEKKKLKTEFGKLNRELKGLEEEARKINWLSGLFKHTTNPEAMDALAKYRAGKISGDTVTYWWNGYKFEKITVGELNKKYENYVAKVSQYNKKIEEFKAKQEKLKSRADRLNREIEKVNKIIREGPKPFERSFTGILWGGLEQLNKIIPKELDYAIGLLNPATMPKTIESIVKGKKPGTVIELAGVPVGIVGGIESTITEGIPGILSLVGVPIKPLTRVPDVGEAVLGSFFGSRRAGKEAEFLLTHPGYTTGELIGEYLTGKALARMFTPVGKAGYKVGKYVAPKIKSAVVKVGEPIVERGSKLIQKLLPHSYMEYQMGKGPYFRLASKLRGAKEFGTFLKEQYLKPLAKKLVKRETKYFKEELKEIKGRGFSKPTPEGGVIGIPELELKTSQIPISFEEYLKLQKELAKNIDEVIGKYSKFLVTEGGEAWDINIAKAKWQTDLINAIRGGGEKGFGGSFMLRNIDIGDVVDALRGIGYEGFKSEFKSGIPVKEYYLFKRLSPETIKAKMFYRTTFKVPETFFEFKFTPEAFAKYIGGEGGEVGLKGFKGFPGGPKGPGGFKPTTMKTLELLGGKIELLPKQEGLLSKLVSGIKITAKTTSKPIVGLSAKTVTTGLNIPIVLPKIATITMPKISEGVLAPQITIPKITAKLEPKIGIREKEEVKPVLSIGPRLEVKPPQIPNIVNMLKPVVGIKPTTEMKLRVGPIPKIGTIPIPKIGTGIKPGIGTIQITPPKITTPTAPPEYPTPPEYPSPPKIPGGPPIPPIPPILGLLGAGYPSEYRGGKYAKAWWSIWFKPPKIKIGKIKLSLLLPPAKKKKKKRRKKKRKKRR